MKRFFDLFVSVLASIILLIPVVLVALVVRLTSEGPIIYWSDRVGRNNKIFRMPKFRTMRMNTPAVATHLMINADQHLTPWICAQPVMPGTSSCTPRSVLKAIRSS